jgi:hypothetical protein
MEITGKIKVVGQTNQVTEKFKKREIVIETEGDYPQFISCQLSQDKCSLGDHLQIGDQVEVSINLRGREWVNPEGVAKYFNTIEIWKIHPADTFRDDQGIPPANTNIGKNFQEEAINNLSTKDDMPF